MESTTKTNWKPWLGLALGLFAVVETFDKPHVGSESGGIILMAILVGLPLWGLFKAQSDGFRTAMVVILAFVAFITVAPSKPGAGGAGGEGCDVDYDGHANPTVCD